MAFLESIWRPLPIALRELSWRTFNWQLKAEFQAKRHSAEELANLKIAKLRELLRRTPYWTSGHLQLAESSFRANDITIAFLSAQAVMALKGTGSKAARARAIQARCYLKRGAVDEARSLVTLMLKDAPQSFEGREDLGAILILEKSFAAAVLELEKIPKDKLSGEGLAALQFARSKLTSTSTE